MAEEENVEGAALELFPVLKQYIPIKFMNKIPAQAQRLLTHIDINFTCIDIEEEYIAVGSNVGILYLYDRNKNKLHKLRNKDYKNAITCTKILKSLECLVVFGCHSGSIFVFKVPFDESSQMEQFIVEGLHKCPITALEWVKNGIKFYSGDSDGHVVCTEIDHLEHQSRSQVLLKEKSEIVQLSYLNMVLLVSTLRHSVIFDFKSDKCCQVGQKDRKYLGKFGATFKSNKEIYACRPGLRLWKSDTGGSIEKTVILKDAFKEALTEDTSEKFDLGPIKVYDLEYLVTWSGSTVLLIDPQQVAVKKVYSTTSIIDLAVCGKEIVILQGIRHVVRLSEVSDGTEIIEEESPNILQDFLAPFKELTTPRKKGSISEAQNKDDSEDVMGWIKRKFSESASSKSDEKPSANDMAARSDLPDVSETSNVFPDLPPILVDPIRDHVLQNLTEQKRDSEEDEIVFKPKPKKKKKHKKRKDDPRLDSPNDPITTKTKDIDTGRDEIDRGANESVFRANGEDNAETDLSLNSPTVEEKGITDSSGENADSLNITTSLSEVTISDKTEDDIGNVDGSLTGMESTEVDIPLSNPAAEMDETEDNDIKSAEDTEIKLLEPFSELNEEVTKSKSPVDIYAGFEFNLRNLNSTYLNRNEDEHLVNDKDRAISMTASSSSTDTEIEENKLWQGIDFVLYDAPGPIISLTASNYHVFCVDKLNAIYFSEFPSLGFVWKVISDQKADQIEVSPSESVAWVLYKGSVYAATQRNGISWRNVVWVPFADDVVNISVGDTIGWYIKSNGRVIYNDELSAEQLYTYPKDYEVPSNVVQIGSCSEVVWMLTADDKLYCMPSVKNNKRKEIKLNGVKGICEFCFGYGNAVYVINCEGLLWFQIVPDLFSLSSNEETWQVETSSYLYELPKEVNYNIFTRLVQGRPSCHGLLASSNAGVWYCQKGSNTIHSNQKCVVGHFWDSVVPLGTVSTMKWKLINAQGVVDSQNVFWAVNNADELFCFTNDFMSSVSINPPNLATMRQVVPTLNTVWFLSTKGEIFVRQDISRKCPQGVWWQSLDINQLGDVKLSHISCSKQVVWACDEDGFVFLRLGALETLPGSSQSQAWVEVESDLPPVRMNRSRAKKPFLSLASNHRHHKALISKVYVGPDHHIVWAIDDKNSIYVRDGMKKVLFIGLIWVYVPGPPAQQLCISRGAVWMLSMSGELYRRFGVTNRCPMGDYWKQIPIQLSHLSVSMDNQLWGIKDESIYSHSFHTIDFQKEQTEIKQMKVVEEDWEDLAEMSDEE